MRTWILAAALVVLSAIPTQAQMVDNSQREENRLLFVAVSPVFGTLGELIGLIYHELFSLDYRVAQGEVLIFFRSDSKQREPERVCRDYLLQPSTQQWAAISAMVGTIIWGNARTSFGLSSDDFMRITVRAILAYAGGMTGARTAVEWLCQKQPRWKRADLMVFTTVLATGLGAALGFNLIW
jgi:hypothetical protein